MPDIVKCKFWQMVCAICVLSQSTVLVNYVIFTMKHLTFWQPVTSDDVRETVYIYNSTFIVKELMDGNFGA